MQAHVHERLGYSIVWVSITICVKLQLKCGVDGGELCVCVFVRHTVTKLQTNAFFRIIPKRCVRHNEEKLPAENI